MQIRTTIRFYQRSVLVLLLLALISLPFARPAHADPSDPIPYAWSEMLNQNRVAELVNQYVKLVQREPSNIQVRLITMRLLFVQWRLESKDQRKRVNTGKMLVKVSKEMIQMHPERAEGYHWYGAGVGLIGLSRGVLNSLQLVPELKNALEKSAKLDPDYLEGSAICQLGRVYTMLPQFPLSIGSQKKAMEYLVEAKKRGPGFSLNQLYLADLLWAMGRNNEALEELDHMVLNKPKNEIEYFTYEVNKAKAGELRKLIESGAKRQPFYDVLSDIQPGLVD